MLSFINNREYRSGNKKKGQSRETGNIGYTRRRKKNHNTICQFFEHLKLD